MKKITLFGLLALPALIGCSQQVNFITLSNVIYKNAIHSGEKSFKIAEYKQNGRSKMYRRNKQSFLHGILDTIIIVERYNAETASLSGTIFSNKDKINYSYDNKDLALLKESMFTRYQLNLLAKWDTVAIREEERKNEIAFGGNIISANRCVVQNGRWVIKEIYFKDFFNLKRDQ